MGMRFLWKAWSVHPLIRTLLVVIAIIAILNWFAASSCAKKFAKLQLVFVAKTT
jgi:hypothetical protein